jgi:hypothetical protein
MSITQQDAVPRTDPACLLTEWKPWPHPNNSLLGHATVAFAGGWVVSAIPAFRRADNSISVGVPNVPQLDAVGRVRLKPDGKRDYRPVISFQTPEARERWQRMVLAALAVGGITGAAENTP